ncbi:uncharacterized protein LOC133172945 isoform X2 [Saccostrea echinata]|uniref:uncharacterized protein LOC133172945 isoform X2 n=1 Tax=Saccostrea echinata TaxID=191078 RepID=UPI002A8007F7|nr:uncharacterized protein LOC133172945 isoform X2 [Saccostrea echinata]
MSESARSTALPPSSATSHGKIRTENSELLTLLREKTNDSSGQINHTTSRLSSKHIADNNPAQPPASAGRRLVDFNNPRNLQSSTALDQLEPPTQLNVDPALTNTETENHTEDNIENKLDSQILVPPLNLDTTRDSEANQTAKFSEPLTTDSELVQSGVERNKYLHEVFVKPPQLPSQTDVSSDPNLHESRKNSASSVKSHSSNPSAHVLSSRSVALHGGGKNNSPLYDHKTEESVPNKESSENQEKQLVTESSVDFQSARSDNFEGSESPHSLVLDSALHALATPGQSAPVTGRQTYNVPSPISKQIPNIDSLSHFSNPGDREEKPVPRTRSSKQGSTLSSRSIPIPGQGSSSPRQSATTRLTGSRDQSATARSSTGVYAVANPAVLVAQGITPAPHQQSVQFTPRPQPRSRQQSLVDSLEAPNKETGEVIKRDQTGERRKSAVSFKEEKEQINSLPTNDPYTEADSPAPGSEPDWDTPRVKDRVPTPHATSDTYRFSPTHPVWEKEDQERQKSPEPLDSSEPPRPVSETQDNQSDRRESPDIPLSPAPLDEDDRKVDSALLGTSASAKSEARVVRTASLPTVKKVYVESPTFTKDEEDEYRFVESRLGEIQDDVEDTLRKLDEETEKQRKIRKQLEEQMATMYAPAYEDQRNGQSYSRNPQYGDPPRENMGSYSNMRHQDDSRSYQEPRRENMGSYSTLRNEDRNSYGEPRRENMGSYSNIRNDDRDSYNDQRRGSRNSYQEQRRDNMGSYTSVRVDDRQSQGDPRRENMGSYTSVRNDDRNSYSEPRRENMGSYASVKNEDFNSYGEPRRDNMGSYSSVRNDDRNSYGEPRRDNMGSYSSVRNDDRQSYAEPRRDNMGSYTSVRNDDKRSYGEPNRENMGSYANVNQERGRNTYEEQRDQGNNQNGFNPLDRQRDSYGRQNEAPDNQRYGDGRDDDRYEDRNYDRKDEQGNRDRYENQDQQPESERYNPQSHLQNMNYEPQDEDLRREAEYQEGLKQRISETAKRDMEIQIPRLPIQSEQFRDSLEEDNFRDWDNPPPNPFANEGGPPPHHQEHHQLSHRQHHQQFEEPKVPDFVDENDTARMEFLHPKSPRYDFIEMNKIDYGKPHEKSYREIKHVREEESKKLDKVFIHPRVPPKSKKKPVKPGLKSAPSKFQAHSPIQELDPDDPAQALWAKRSAQLKKKDSKTSSGNSNKHRGLQRNQSDSRLVRPYGEAHQVYSNPRPIGESHQVHSNSRPIGESHQKPKQVVYHTSNNQHLEPIGNRPVLPIIPRTEPQYHAPHSDSLNFPEHLSDHQSPTLRSRPLDLKPITQEIVTEDGQRISVDINLKVLSPPPGSGTGAPSVVHAEVHPKEHSRRPTGMQYQLEDNYPQPEQDSHQNYNQFQYYDAYPRHNNYYPDDTRYDQENVAPGGGEQPQQYEDTYRMSPYPKIPPISITEEELDRQLAEFEQNGYASMYKQHKNKPAEEKPWYQVYTIKDYRKMQNEVRLSRAPLGPDLDNETYKEKMEKRHKQFEYARMVMEKNRQELDIKKPPSHPRKEEEKPNKRKTAIEYSKGIPKPNVKPRPNQYNSYEVAAQLSPAAKRSGPPSPTQTVDVIDLQKLKQRHDQEKQNVASIRQNMESVPQKA